MKYRVGEVQNMTDGRDSHSGFNILNSHGAPIVTFSYLDGADAAKARVLAPRCNVSRNPRRGNPGRHRFFEYSPGRLWPPTAR